MNQHWPTKFGLCSVKMQLYRSPDGKKNIVDGPTKPRVKIEGWTNSPKSVCFVPMFVMHCQIRLYCLRYFFLMVIVCWPFLFSVERDCAFEGLWKWSFTIPGLKVEGRTRFGAKLSHTWQRTNGKRSFPLLDIMDIILFRFHVMSSVVLLANFWNIFDQAFIGFLVMLPLSGLVSPLKKLRCSLVSLTWTLVPKFRLGEGSIWDDKKSLLLLTGETHE